MPIYMVLTNRLNATDIVDEVPLAQVQCNLVSGRALLQHLEVEHHTDIVPCSLMLLYTATPQWLQKPVS